MAARHAFRHASADHGRLEIVDADLSDYFSSIPHGPLMCCVSRRVADGTLLSAIKRWLTAPVIERDQRTIRCTTEAKDRHRGTPQGSPISPLLANLYFRRFLLAWERSGHRKTARRICRQLRRDDLVICCRPGNGSTALATMRQLMTRLGLTVNEAKTRLARLPEENFDFLGYSIGRFYGKDGAPYIGTRPSRKSVRRLLQRVHDATTPHKHAEDPELRVVAINRLPPRLGRSISNPRAGSPDLQIGTLVCSTASATMVGATQRTSGHRIPPVSGRVSLRDARPLCLAARSRRPAEREGLMTQEKAGCGKSACPVVCPAQKAGMFSRRQNPAGVKVRAP